MARTYSEVRNVALAEYRLKSKKTKRRTYIRAQYFHKEKIFLSIFWEHLYDKSPKERKQRLRYYKCALDLLEHSKVPPTRRINPNKETEILYRFLGEVQNELFAVQVKEDLNSGHKYFISVFPWKRQ